MLRTTNRARKMLAPLARDFGSDATGSQLMTVIDAPATDEVVDIKRIARSLNLNVATIARMTARGHFAPALPIKVHKKLYLRSAVEAWWVTVLGGKNGVPFPWAPAEPDDDD